MKTRMFFSLLLVTLLVLAGSEAQAQYPAVKKVNCTKGQTITRALLGCDGIPMTIQLKGTCNENVEIVRDDVTLIADPSGGTLVPLDPNTSTIAVRGARTVIDGLTVTGGRNGISVSGSGGATIRNCTVQNTGRVGIVFYHGGHGLVDNCTVQNNQYIGIFIEGGSATITNSTISSNTGTGIHLHMGGSAKIGITDSTQYAGNTISNNQSSGIFIAHGSTADIGGNTIQGNCTDPNSPLGQAGVFIHNAGADLVGNNKITGNGGSGVSANASTVHIGDPVRGLPTTGSFANVITGNAKGGISGFSGASLFIRDATIDGNTGNGVMLNLRSTSWMFGNTINNNTGNGIFLAQGAALLLQDPAVKVTGNVLFGLQCAGTESSFSGNTSGISGNGSGDPEEQVSPSCTGF